MGSYFNCTINCEFPANLRMEYVELLRYITTPEYQLEVTLDVGDEFIDSIPNIVERGFHLRPHPSSGLSISRFVAFRGSDQHIYSYTLQYIDYSIGDDVFANFHVPLLIWIAKHCVPGLIGYFSSTMQALAHEFPLSLLQARDGKLITVDLSEAGKISRYD